MKIGKFLPTLQRVFLLLLVFAAADAKGQESPDSLIFFLNSRPVIFRVNRAEISQADSISIKDSLLTLLNSLGPERVIVGRAAASPEGPWWNNVRLAYARRNRALSYLKKFGFDVSEIKFRTVPEDYDLLLHMMTVAGDPDRELVRYAIDRYGREFALMKNYLMRVDKGRLWQHLLKDYFPQLRAVRIVATDKREANFMMTARQMPPLQRPTAPPSITQPFVPEPVIASDPFAYKNKSKYRREFLSVKTNLLLLGAYMPINDYGWCPMPNVEVEYYPKHGHFTFGGNYDIPWWVGTTDNHKYFEFENITLYSRYYFKTGDISVREPGNGAAFRKWYAALYAHAARYQLGFNAQKGWKGEGLGGGLGAGYVLPLTKRGHWRLDFGLQLGFAWAQYDPFVYGDPVDGHIDGHYYYKYTGDSDKFKKRQYHLTWLGPTRVGITLGYDLLYRKESKGISLRSKSKNK